MRALKLSFFPVSATTSPLSDTATAAPLSVLAHAMHRMNLATIVLSSSTLHPKGWSETKISRWLAQKQAVNARDDRVRSTRENPHTDDWKALIEEALDSRLTPYIGILLHLYSGPLLPNSVVRPPGRPYWRAD